MNLECKIYDKEQFKGAFCLSVIVAHGDTSFFVR